MPAKMTAGPEHCVVVNVGSSRCVDNCLANGQREMYLATRLATRTHLAFFPFIFPAVLFSPNALDHTAFLYSYSGTSPDGNSWFFFNHIRLSTSSFTSNERKVSKKLKLVRNR